MPTITKAKPAAKPSKKTGEEKPVLYPSLVVCGIEVPEDKTVITEQIAKELLGYEEETEGVKFGSDYLGTLPDGTKFRCVHNTANRPLDEAHSRKLAQDILNGHWKLNLETIIIGLHGQVLSGQHRLLALIFATWEWRKGDNADHWRSVSPEEPVLRSLVAFGCSEDKEVTRTLDNVKPRSLADVLFADGELFASAKTSDRKNLTNIADYGIRCLWHRTGAKNDAYSPIRTHSESLEFLSTHPRLVRCIKHIYDEDGDNKALRNLIPLGTASGLMYMMACSEVDKEDYDGTESSLKFGLWDKACEFFVKLASGEGGFKLVRTAIGYLADEDGEGGGTASEKIALITNAWNVFASGGALTDKSLGYEYEVRNGTKRMIENGLEYLNEEDDDGKPVRTNRLATVPSVGGIDLGDPDEAKREEEAAERAQRKIEQQKLKEQERLLKNKGKDAPPAETTSERLSRIHKQHPEKILLFPLSDGSGYRVWGGDALRVHKVLKALPEPELKDGVQALFVPTAMMITLQKSKLPLGVCGLKDGIAQCLGDYTPGGYIPFADDDAPVADPLPPVASKPKAAPAPAPKPAAKPAAKAPTAPAKRGGIGK